LEDFVDLAKEVLQTLVALGDVEVLLQERTVTEAVHER
jgi:hypothetical protein